MFSQYFQYYIFFLINYLLICPSDKFFHFTNHFSNIDVLFIEAAAKAVLLFPDTEKSFRLLSDNRSLDQNFRFSGLLYCIYVSFILRDKLSRFFSESSRYKVLYWNCCLTHVVSSPALKVVIKVTQCVLQNVLVMRMYVQSTKTKRKLFSAKHKITYRQLVILWDLDFPIVPQYSALPFI